MTSVLISPRVVALRVFGSHVRGDAREDSDWDVLAVVQSSNAKMRDDLVVEVRRTLPLADVSFYAPSTIRRMFQEGHLFAWHLYRESMSLGHEPDFINELGEPRPYDRALDDIEALRDILNTVEASTLECPTRATYEAGLIFVSARNIALSASWFCGGHPDFSRHSPFGLDLGTVFPLTREEYDECVRARLAGTRGIECTPLPAEFVAEAASKVSAWAAEISNCVAELVSERTSPQKV